WASGTRPLGTPYSLLHGRRGSRAPVLRAGGPSGRRPCPWDRDTARTAPGTPPRRGRATAAAADRDRGRLPPRRRSAAPAFPPAGTRSRAGPRDRSLPRGPRGPRLPRRGRRRAGTRRPAAPAPGTVSPRRPPRARSHGRPAARPRSHTLWRRARLPPRSAGTRTANPSPGRPRGLPRRRSTASLAVVYNGWE